jgi:5-methylcytosine-specific restriction endonuclease McrA
MSFNQRGTPEERKAYWRDYNKRRSDYRADYRAKNKDRIRAQQQTPEARAKQKERNKKLRMKDPQRLRALTKDWIKRNPEKLACLQARRYALRKGAQGSHTLVEWKTLCSQHNGCCAYCGRERELTRDHVIPLSQGGSDYISNILPACASCNAKKGNRMTVEELRAAL